MPLPQRILDFLEAQTPTSLYVYFQRPSRTFKIVFCQRQFGRQTRKTLNAKDADQYHAYIRDIAKVNVDIRTPLFFVFRD